MFKLGFRLVLPADIIKPEEIDIIWFSCERIKLIQDNPDGTEQWVDVFNARKDLQSPFKDKNGRVLFENDRITFINCNHREIITNIVFVNEQGVWKTCEGTQLWLIYDISEWVDIVPYSENKENK